VGKAPLVLIGLLALAGCGGAKSASSPTSSVSTSPQTAYCQAVQKTEDDEYNGTKIGSTISRSTIDQDFLAVAEDAMQQSS